MGFLDSEIDIFELDTRDVKNAPSFRGWFYFRMGWSTYFAFIFAAINTLTVTYFLAIEKYPFLVAIFPNFPQYVIIISAIGVPLLILIGYVHYKRTMAFRAEADVMVEANPYQRRNFVNNTMNVKLNLKLLSLILKLSNNEKLSEKESKEIQDMQNELTNIVDNRSFANDLDLEYYKKEIKKELES